MNKPILGLYAKDFTRAFNIPERATVGSAGYDLKASFDASFNPIDIPPGERRLIKTNLVVEIPPGFYGRIAPRSGLAFKHGIDVMAGVCDSDYRGEVGVILVNLDTVTGYSVNNGDKIAQLIIEPYAVCDLVIRASGDTSHTERNEGGFGSTGK